MNGSIFTKVVGDMVVLRYYLLFLLLIAFTAFSSSCGNPSSQRNTQNKTQSRKSKAVSKRNSNFSPFYVYSDKGARSNHYVPSGFMPDGKCVSINERHTEACRKGETCIKVEYDIECSRQGQQWAGIYWLNPANNWGNRKGGYNLKGAKKLVFWAKGTVGGEQIESFIMGGITGDYPDSDMAMLGPVILSTTWREYSIDLQGKDLSYISNGFGWTTSERVNGDSCVFYLDEIRYE